MRKLSFKDRTICNACQFTTEWEPHCEVRPGTKIPSNSFGCIRMSRCPRFMTWWNIQVSPMFYEANFCSSLLLCRTLFGDISGAFAALCLQECHFFTIFPSTPQPELPDVEAKGQAKGRCDVNKHHCPLCYTHQCWWLDISVHIF